MVSCKQCRSHDGNDFETTCCFRGVFRGGKIAALLHDVGALQGKAGHALRGKQFAEAYFRKQKICLPYQEEILSSIENHSNGFDSEELMTLALIISDKLDITASRVAKAGYFVLNAAISILKKIEIMLSEQEVCVSFTAEEELDLEELNAFYFMPKVFKAIAAFSGKIQRRPIVLLNNQEWPVPTKSFNCSLTVEGFFSDNY